MGCSSFKPASGLGESSSLLGKQIVFFLLIFFYILVVEFAALTSFLTKLRGPVSYRMLDLTKHNYLFVRRSECIQSCNRGSVDIDDLLHGL